MAATYDLIHDYESPDALQTVAPFWVVGFARFANAVTWDPNQRKSLDLKNPMQERDGERLVVTNDAVQVSVGASKDAHVTSLQVTLNPGSRNYLQEVLPGDWVACSMLASEAQGREVADKYRKGQAVNGWQDGLKFIGRVKSVRKKVSRDPSTGVPNVSYAVTAAGFTEFDSPVIYHPQLVDTSMAGQAYTEFGMMVEDIIRGADDSVNKDRAVDINRVIPKFTQVIFGEGAFWNAHKTEGLSASPNRKFLIPPTVAAWLGAPGAKTFADIVEVMMGVQHYRKVAVATNDTATDSWKLFQPDDLNRKEGVLRAGKDLIGVFPLMPPPMDGQPVWQVLGAFLSAPVNEMYVALRPRMEEEAKGALLPHLIVRQTPYSTPQVREAVMVPETIGPDAGRKKDHDDFDVTEFDELPRWKMPPDLINSADIGRADAMRVNVVHVSGTGPGYSKDETGPFWRAPPNIDDLDVQRNGVRPYMPSVNCYLQDMQRGPKKWRDLMTDIVMGQHLTFSGTVQSVGIQAPIQPGDNLELDGLVFHIESVQHVCTISPDGHRSFVTNATLTHGVLDGKTAKAYQATGKLDERSSHYAGLAEGDDGIHSTATTVDDAA